MTAEEIKNECFNMAWNNKCEGSCEKHRGECSVVYVMGWAGRISRIVKRLLQRIVGEGLRWMY